VKYHKSKSIIENLCLYVTALISFDAKEEIKKKIFQISRRLVLHLFIRVIQLNGAIIEAYHG